MDAYLEIAKKVIELRRIPLSARSIINCAYSIGIVPKHLHGKTQHKTLQARISEDISSRPLNGDFVRTEPGRFFLRNFLEDNQIPENFRRQFVTRPRKYDLKNLICLFISLEKNADRNISNIRSASLFYQPYPADCCDQHSVPVISYSIFVRNGKILMHRPHNRFKDPIKADRSVGFTEYVLPDDVDIFHQDSIGIYRGVERLIVGELNGHELARSPWGVKFSIKELEAHVFHNEAGIRGGSACVFFLVVDLDRKFDPVLRASAMREMRWIDIFNLRTNIDDLDRFSKIAVNMVRNELVSRNSARSYATVDAPAS